MCWHLISTKWETKCNWVCWCCWLLKIFVKYLNKDIKQNNKQIILLWAPWTFLISAGKFYKNLGMPCFQQFILKTKLALQGSSTLQHTIPTALFAVLRHSRGYLTLSRTPVFSPFPLFKILVTLSWQPSTAGIFESHRRLLRSHKSLCHHSFMPWFKVIRNNAKKEGGGFISEQNWFSGCCKATPCQHETQC